MKLAIAGPGRSGTSLLVKLLGSWGLSTQSDENSWHNSAQAGFESIIGSDSSFDVDKDPWAYQYMDNLTDEQLGRYSALIIPIRKAEHAATSRAVQERLSRFPSLHPNDWMWKDWGTVPGGAVYTTDVESIRTNLESGLWTLIESASRRNLKIVILNYPRFATDFEYLWSELGPLLDNRIEKGDAKKSWETIVDTKRIRVVTEEQKVSWQELSAMVRQLSDQVNSLVWNRDLLEEERNLLATERESLLEEIAGNKREMKLLAQQFEVITKSRSRIIDRITMPRSVIRKSTNNQ